MVYRHYLDAIITFALLAASMLTGALTILAKDRVRRIMLLIHVITSILAFLAFTITFLRAP